MALQNYGSASTVTQTVLTEDILKRTQQLPNSLAQPSGDYPLWKKSKELSGENIIKTLEGFH